MDAFGPQVGARFGFGYSEDGGPEGIVYEDVNRGVTPSFLMTQEPDGPATEREGRPMFKDRETVLLRVAGDAYNVVSKPVDEEIKRRFPEAYRRWSANREDGESVSGTPLRMWPMISTAEIASLHALNIFNVEGLANVADVHLAKSPTLRELRAKAESWLAEAKTGAEAMRLRAELEKRDGALIDALAQISALREQVEALASSKPKKAA